ncbi:MAG: hypothetical protein IJT62_01345 [Oscillospiraceae bacterium]|nr:hypothetical protein [Oscillospiraceae bacterium]
MHDFLIGHIAPILWVMTAVYALLLAALIKLRKGDKRRGVLPLLMALVVFGLLYDVFVQALGTLMSAGGLLSALSRLRYVFHGMLIPLCFPICTMALRMKPKALKAVWIVTLILILAGAASGFAVKMEPVQTGALLRYASADDTPAWANGLQLALSIVPVLFLVAAGLIAWIREKNPHLFFAGLLMFAFAALGPATGHADLSFVINMFGELFMALFFWLFAGKRAKTDRR